MQEIYKIFVKKYILTFAKNTFVCMWSFLVEYVHMQHVFNHKRWKLHSLTIPRKTSFTWKTRLTAVKWHLKVIPSTFQKTAHLWQYFLFLKFWHYSKEHRTATAKFSGGIFISILICIILLTYVNMVFPIVIWRTIPDWLNFFKFNNFNKKNFKIDITLLSKNVGRFNRI